MRNLLLFISVTVILIAGLILYLEHDKKDLVESNNSVPTDSPAPAVKDKIDKAKKVPTAPSAKELDDNVFVPENVDTQNVDDVGSLTQPPDRDYDWKTDTPSNHAHKPDPWEKRTLQEETIKENPDSELSPDEKADFLHNQWIQMFGDIPQVHVASEYMRKMARQERITIDDHIAGLEASHYLFPDGGFKMQLEMFKSMKANGIPIIHPEDFDKLPHRIEK